MYIKLTTEIRERGKRKRWAKEEGGRKTGRKNAFFPIMSTSKLRSTIMIH